MPEMPKIRTRSEAVQRPPDARAAQGRITQMIVTDGTILSARIAGATYRGCPVAMTFDEQTKQGNSLLKANYGTQHKQTVNPCEAPKQNNVSYS